jgi:hypothetical protein
VGDKRYSLKWLSEAMGLHPRQQGQAGSLPPNTTADRHDMQHHLVHSTNYGHTDRAILIVTGIPEGAKELARSEGYTLAPLFAQADDETAVAQVYIGSRILDVLDVRKRLPGYFMHGLRQAAATQEIHISAVSAGMFALAAFREMPDEAFQRISMQVQSVTLASPFAGTDCIGNTALRMTARLLGFPSTKDALGSIARIVESLLQRDRMVRVSLGEQDQLIDSEAAAAAFSQRFPGASVMLKPRRHGPAPEELWPD